MALYCFEQYFRLNLSELYITKPLFLAIRITFHMQKSIVTTGSVVFLCNFFSHAANGQALKAEFSFKFFRKKFFKKYLEIASLQEST